MCRQCLMCLLDRSATSILFGGHHSSYVFLVSHGYMFPKYRVSCGLALVPYCSMFLVRCTDIVSCKAQFVRLKLCPSRGVDVVAHSLVSHICCTGLGYIATRAL